MTNQTPREEPLLTMPFDFSSGLGYGLLYQPVIGAHLSSNLYRICFSSLHRRSLRLSFYEKRM